MIQDYLIRLIILYNGSHYSLSETLFERTDYIDNVQSIALYSLGNELNWDIVRVSTNDLNTGCSLDFFDVLSECFCYILEILSLFTTREFRSSIYYSIWYLGEILRINRMDSDIIDSIWFQIIVRIHFIIESRFCYFLIHTNLECNHNIDISICCIPENSINTDKFSDLVLDRCHNIFMSFFCRVTICRNLNQKCRSNNRWIILLWEKKIWKSPKYWDNKNQNKCNFFIFEKEFRETSNHKNI